jgi:hypothetical protein
MVNDVISYVTNVTDAYIGSGIERIGSSCSQEMNEVLYLGGRYMQKLSANLNRP